MLLSLVRSRLHLNPIEDTEPEPVKDPLNDGFELPAWYVKNTWLYHEKTGQFPDGKSYNEQSTALLRDWDVLDKRYQDIFDHCKDLEPEDIWLPVTLTLKIEDEVEEEEPTLSLFQRLRGAD